MLSMASLYCEEIPSRPFLPLWFNFPGDTSTKFRETRAAMLSSVKDPRTLVPSSSSIPSPFDSPSNAEARKV
jgi:hypothetical protein